jgi:protocatechuate 4,5-dioxygenase alpha chain
VLARDYNRMLDEGGNIYFLAKIFSTDGKSFLQAVGTMTGMSPEDYQAMMVAGRPLARRRPLDQGQGR